MQWVASGFLFVRGDSFVHRLDPRTRLFLTAGMFLISLVSHILELSILIALTFVLISVSRKLKRFSKSMVFALGLSIFTFVLDYFFFPQQPAFLNALTYSLRLFAVISVTSVYFLTTTPDELEQVMRWLHLPKDFVMVFVIAVRFVPVLLLDALQIMDAQRSRGLEFEKGGIVKRLKNTIPLLVPLIAVAVNRSLDLAEAMDSRAYGAQKTSTSLYVHHFASRDHVVLTLAAFFGAIGMYYALFGHLL